MLDQFTVAFHSGPLAVGLHPDSRDYVLFTMAVVDNRGKWHISSLEKLTCELLENLFTILVEAMRWIQANCVEIKEDNRHLYFQFKRA